MEIEPSLRVSSDILEESGIKHRTPGYKEKWFIHYNKEVPKDLDGLGPMV